MDKKNKVFIIGTGPLALSAGWELGKSKYELVFIDQNERSGGLARPLSFGNDIVDYYYHFYYDGDSAYAEDFLKDVSGKCDIHWQKISTSTYSDGRYINYDSIFHIAWNFKCATIKIIFALIKIKVFNINKDLDKISAVDWANSQFGQIFTSVIWESLLKDKFGFRYKDVSALWLATRIKRHLSTKSIFGKSKFGYLRETYGPSFDIVERELKSNGAKFHYNSRVIDALVSNNRVISLKTNQKIYSIAEGDCIVSTIPLSSLKKVPSILRHCSYLSKMESVSVIVLILKLNCALSKNYWTTVVDPTLPFNLLIEQYNLYKDKGYICYLSKYTDADSALYRTSDAEIFDIFLHGLKKIHKKIQVDNILEFKVVRSTCAAPLPKINSTAEIPGFETPLTNFFHAGFEQIYPEDRGVGNSIKVGIDLANFVKCYSEH